MTRLLFRIATNIWKAELTLSCIVDSGAPQPPEIQGWLPENTNKLSTNFQKFSVNLVINLNDNLFKFSKGVRCRQLYKFDK